MQGADTLHPVLFDAFYRREIKMKIVITDYEFPNLNPEHDAFKNLPAYDLVEAKCTTPEECAVACKDADGVLNQWNHLTAR